WVEELSSVNHRDYCTSFYFNDPDQIAANFENLKPLKGHLFVGKVLEKTGPSTIRIQVRNKIFKNDHIEVVGKKGPLSHDKIIDIKDQNGNEISFAQPGSIVVIEVKKEYVKNDLIRRIGDSP
ncbi:MAG: U32 family peptidase, partial [Desulfobacterales bacterium]|nr:U32 family peptidase [Desulfobacterales bacterium]